MSTEGLIALLEKKRNHLSKIENQVLDYILTHMTEISSQTIYEVAQALFVSTATISRTAKHLGYRGFQELKYAIVQSVQSESTESDSRSFQAITQQLIANVQVSFQQMDEAKVAEMLKMIERANTIEVFGVGGSFPICTDFARKLTFLGKKAYARSDWDEQAAAVKNLDGQDLAIFVSYTGETKGILAYARVAQEQQVPMISLISTKHLGKIVDDDVICQRDDTLSSARRFKFKNCCHLFVRYGFINVCRGKAAAVILCNTILNDVRGYRKSVASFFFVLG